MGVLVGVLVQTVRTVTEVEKELSQLQRVENQMEALLDSLGDHMDDADGTQYFDAIALEGVLADASTHELLKNIDVDPYGLIDVCGFLLEANGWRLTREQFKQMVLDLRGKNTAKVKDHIETRKFVHQE